MSRCDVDHELITFRGPDCPMCRLRDTALDVVSQFEQLILEFEEELEGKKPPVANLKKELIRRAKIIQWPVMVKNGTFYGDEPA